MSEWPFRLGSGRSVHVLPFSSWLILLFRRPLLEGEAAPDRAATVAQPAVVPRAPPAVEPQAALVLEERDPPRPDGVAAAGRVRRRGVEDHDPVPEGDGEVLDGAGAETRDLDEHLRSFPTGLATRLLRNSLEQCRGEYSEINRNVPKESTIIEFQ